MNNKQVYDISKLKRSYLLLQATPLKLHYYFFILNKLLKDFESLKSLVLNSKS